MKAKIEAARRARELASPRPHTKKRAASFAGGRSTPRSSQEGWSGVAGATSRGAAGRRAAAARTKARSASESGSRSVSSAEHSVGCVRPSPS